jgi:HK97 gp10 family phage protein
MPRAEIKIDTSSLKHILTLMEDIDKKVKRKGIKKALRKGGKILVDAAVERVQKKYRVLAKALGIREKVVINSKDQYGYAVIGARRRAGKWIKGLEHIPTKYAHFVEYGVNKHPIGKGDVTNEELLKRKDKSLKANGPMHPGFAAKPYLRPAWDNNRERVLGEMERVLRETIEEGRA